jgi:hypothetical protein
LPWIALAALFGAVLWLHSQRRRPALAPAPGAAAPSPATAEPVDLTKHDGQTIDFSSGQPVVKDSPADRAALEKAAKEMEEATKDMTFTPPKPKEPEQKPAEPPKK